MKTIIHKYQRMMGALNYAAFLLLIFTLPFPWSYTQVMCVVWIAAWFLEGRWASKANWHSGKNMLPMALMVLFIGWYALSLRWSSNVAQGIVDIKRSIILLAAPLIGLCGVNEYYKPIQIKTTLLIACLTSVVAYHMVMQSALTIVDLYPYSRTFWMLPWDYLGTLPVSVLKHRLYYCLVLCLSLAFSGDIWRHYKQQYSSITTTLTICIADLILITTIILTGSRTMMLLLPVFAVLFILRNVKRKYIIPTLAGGLILVAMAGYYLSKHDTRIIKTIEEHQSVTIDSVKSDPLRYEPRIYLHYTAIQHAPQYGCKGLGIGTARNWMIHCFEEDQLPQLEERAYEPHSQYLTTWIELGPIAVIFLIFIICFAPWCYRGPTRWDAIYIATIFAWAMLTESCLSRVSGLYILTAMLILLLTEDRQQSINPHEAIL